MIPFPNSAVLLPYRLYTFGRRNPEASCYPFVASTGLIETPVYEVVYDTLTHTLDNLRRVEKNLKYWKSEGSISISDDSEILPTITHLSDLRRSLCTFLSKVYAENDKFRERWYKRWEKSKSLALYIDSINAHFLELEESLEELCPTRSLSFKKPGNENEDLVLRWSDDNFRNAVDLLSSNLNKLDDYVSFLVVKYRKPSKRSRRWMYYTFGAIGVSVFSLWLLRHSRLSGVVHNWVIEAKESVTGLFIDQVKQLTSVNRHKELMKLKQVQSTRDFSFEKELKYPTQNLSGEDSARPLLSQIQKLQIGVETARELLELNHQILMASERNFATLAAIPAIVLSLGGLMISYALVKQVLGEGRSAGAQRRLLVKEVEERFIEFQKCLLNDCHYNHGLILCTLDRLYRAVESSAKKTGEWQSLREDVIALGKLNYSDADKLMVITHFKEMYVCLCPPPRHLAPGKRDSFSGTVICEGMKLKRLA